MTSPTSTWWPDARRRELREHCCLVGLAICTDGPKVPVGRWLGDTENRAVFAQLLADLVDGRLSTENDRPATPPGAVGWAMALDTLAAHAGAHSDR